MVDLRRTGLPPKGFSPEQEGDVIEFDAAAGLGEVRDSAGNVWLFHSTEIADGTRTIEPGTRVTFTVSSGGPGRWEAHQLLKIL